ncbi:MAG: LysR family transcriptional regulator [Deltaproteobacteria bacterium]|nr:LysR family transcriptional regulator [Deltaproteobacteria bacterium]MBW2013086.1 LysR family transcriptional regulator [Deltaproteobacteria bacterium]
MKKDVAHNIPSIDFDFRQLEIFCRVVELKSFSKAADAVFLAQPSVSERIATLESRVGTQLLDRLGRQVVPTAAGKLLYKHACLLLDMKKHACNEMQGFLGTQKGKIHMGGSTIPGEYIFPKILKKFRKKHPLVTVTLTISDTSTIEKRVMNGDFELGVVGSKSTNDNLICRELWKDELVLAVPFDHKWADKKQVTFDDLSKEPFILRETGSGTLKIIKEYFKLSHAKNMDSFNIVARLGSSTAVKEGIRSGLGISILSLRALDTELKTGIIKALKIKDLAMLRKFYLIRDKRRNVSPLCQAMLDFLASTSEK